MHYILSSRSGCALHTEQQIRHVHYSQSSRSGCALHTEQQIRLCTTYRAADQAVHYKRFDDVYLSAHRLALIIEDPTQSGKLLVRVK